MKRIRLFIAATLFIFTLVTVLFLQPERTKLASAFVRSQLNLGETLTDELVLAETSRAARAGAGVQRTMQWLHTSTPEHPNTVRILIYGQSISKQSWWLDVADNLNSRFPSANVLIENRAIGGFDSSRLIRTAEHDLYSFYPDLLLFHVYGSEEDYESIIARLRAQTTAEIMLISDHITWLPSGTSEDSFDELKRFQWHNQHSLEWLPAIADKYGCELLELRAPWTAYLTENSLEPQDLLKDQVHLNERGSELMASLIEKRLTYDPSLSPALPATTVQFQKTFPPSQWRDGKFEATFEGNRVTAFLHQSAASSPKVEFFIDGQRPSQYPDSYAVTRSSNTVGVEWPAILQVGHQNPLLLEEWKAVITEIDDRAEAFTFTVFGSLSGFDGSGRSDQPFVSNSGRVVIQPQDWWLANAQRFSEVPTPEGFQITWEVEPLFADGYFSSGINPAPNPAALTEILVSQHLDNGSHTLEIVTDSPDLVAEIRTDHPPSLDEISAASARQTASPAAAS